MPQFSSLVATTETEAVNEMLAAIGEAPISDLDTATHPDVLTAITVVKRVIRQVLLEGWRFNTELGWEVSPTTTYSWTDTDGQTTTLNVFEPPSDLMAFQVTRTSAQKDLRLDVRSSRKYPAGSGGTTIFYDYGENRDGLDSDGFDYLYIDYVRFVDFTSLPQVARTYIVARATREFAESMGSQSASVWAEEDILRAYRRLKREEGIVDRKNFIDNWEAYGILGARPRQSFISTSQHDSPNWSS
ncbi:MAG: hypothetical protein GWN18_19955 [Thermoplasmata archaeon]|nr:hypothetical protein [Thermoplasmata archaeon]NIS14402.1 hypothetical protein [Thermoplasmata archaeon]NIS22246.1 hypothetical protein [Thermoplasmata archaeon]NIT80129.1 hypothetical protein [Thermoplasmata archaeon]NIU51254.1 hypothetical protein [Thermoplasmata archaeon]